MSDFHNYMVLKIESRKAREVVIKHHYLHRAPPCSECFGLFAYNVLIGVVIYGVPASHHVRKGMCPSNPALVYELNRLWVSDACPRNTESWFVRKTLGMMSSRIIVSYADTAHGHNGTVYRAMGFEYAGWTDMDRKTPRCDYSVPGKHSRDAFRNGSIGDNVTKIRRRPKIKYWCVTGSRSEKRKLLKIARWPSLSWSDHPPPSC